MIGVQSQQDGLEELVELVAKEGTHALALKVLAWVRANVSQKQCQLELEKPLILYTLKEQAQLKRRLAVSFAEGFLAGNYDHYVEKSDTKLTMNVLMLEAGGQPLISSEFEPPSLFNGRMKELEERLLLECGR